MCDYQSVQNWLEILRKTTENYDHGLPTTDVLQNSADDFENMSDDGGEVQHEMCDDFKSDSEHSGDMEILKRLSGSYENIWNCTTNLIEENDLKRGHVCRISIEFDESVQELCVDPIVLTKIDLTIPTSILQWKTDLMYEYCSEEDEIQEYASLERINEEKGQNYFHQTRPFPIENAVEIRHHIKPARKPSVRSQTVHEYAFGNVEQQLEDNYVEVQFDIKGVTKILCDGATKKLGKGQTVKVCNDQMTLTSDRNEEDVIIDCLNQTEYKPISKKELVITKLNENSRTYKLQFDSTKDMNLAVIDLERYYGTERSYNKTVTYREEKLQIRHRLLKLLGKRSSKDMLERKGIIKNEPIFGNTLRHLHEMYKEEVPEFVTRIIQLIELPKNICSVGLYRASGNLATIQKIRYHVDKNNLNFLEEYKTDIDVLTGCLKLFFRELNEPLIPHKTYEELCKFIDVELTAKHEDTIRHIINKLEKSHKRTLMTLLDHLLKVETHSEENKMDAYNISIVWGPTLIRPPDNCTENILLNHTNANKIIELLLRVSSKYDLTKKNDSSQNVNNIKENHNNEAARDNLLNRNALMIELNENLTNSLKKGSSKDNLVRNVENLTKSRDDLPRSPSEDTKFDLESFCSNSKERVPEFVLKIVPLIEKGINLDMLYKRNGSNEKLDKIRKKVMKPKSNLNSLEKYNVHDLAWALKSFFLELKTPIIPKQVFENLIFTTEERIEITKLRNTKREYTNSNIPFRETLDFLLKHLVKISQHEEHNKMSKHNLATEWAPILCNSFIQNREFSPGSCIHVIETLLQIYDNKTIRNIHTEKDLKHNMDIYNANYQSLESRLAAGYGSPEKDNLLSPTLSLGRSPDKHPVQVLPSKFERRGFLPKNDSSLYRVSRFFNNTLSMYDNVPSVDGVKHEATILDGGKVEDRTKL